MATVGSARDPDVRLAGSQFLITLGDDLDYLNGKGAIFGRVAEGFDTLEKINDAFTDSKGRPLKDIRIRHSVILEDPYKDPPGLVEPDKSPLPSQAQLATVMIADDEELDTEMDEGPMEKLRREREARAQALTLEMVGDLPFAEVKPPENVLFVCKLNPVTQGMTTTLIPDEIAGLTVTADEDLNLIFSRFGKILSCEVIRDKRTGDSLQYAFIEFENQKDCEQAYFKMQGVLIDDHRIHVDFSQSVSAKLHTPTVAHCLMYPRFRDCRIHGEPPPIRKGQSSPVGSAGFPAWRKSGNTVQGTMEPDLQGMAWSLIGMTCVAKGRDQEATNAREVAVHLTATAAAMTEGIVTTVTTGVGMRAATGEGGTIASTTVGEVQQHTGQRPRRCLRGKAERIPPLRSKRVDRQVWSRPSAGGKKITRSSPASQIVFLQMEVPLYSLATIEVNSHQPVITSPVVPRRFSEYLRDRWFCSSRFGISGKGILYLRNIWMLSPMPLPA